MNCSAHIVPLNSIQVCIANLLIYCNFSLHYEIATKKFFRNLKIPQSLLIGEFMKITDVLEQIQKYEIVPVASFSLVEDALKISEGLMNKNLPIIEITFRTGDAPLFIQSVKKEFSSMLVGAGSVVSVKMAKDAVNAGADFIVMPGFNEDVVKFCKKKNVLCVPGVLTPTEITKAINLGCDILKLFPAEISGGVKYLKAVSAPFPKVKFIPTGGINEGNYKDYLEQKNVLAVGGSWPIDELKSK